MIKILSSLIFLLIAFQSVAQSNISYVFSLSPNYNYRSYKEVKNDNSNSDKANFDTFKNYYDDREDPQVGISSFVGFSLDLKRKVKLTTGLTYKSLFERVSVPIPEAIYQYNGSLGSFYGNNPEVKKFNNTYQYLGIQVMGAHNLVERNKYVIGIEIGAEIDKLINYKIGSHEIPSMNHYTNSDVKYQYSDPQQVTLNLCGGLMFEYKPNEKISLYSSPQFTRYITPNVTYDIPVGEDSNMKINQFNYFAEIQFGIIFKNLRTKSQNS
ncbi:hypothetical protein [Marinoscillum pacificum]|uniref:hypothetical protein n=1 Tax=Marinoscillum pacificum TaxID=392723 RepID=UPI0021583A61|nr:hypothetical protein [Marinoscillum pacificum]